MIKKFSGVYLILLTLIFSCQSKKEKVQEPKSIETFDSTAVSLYTLDIQIIDLEKLALVKNYSETRDFLLTGNYKANLSQSLYKEYCLNNQCFAINDSGIVSFSPNENMSNVELKGYSNAFIIPASEGCVIVSTKDNDNLYHIDKIETSGIKTWSTILEHKKQLDSTEGMYPYATLKGYNEHIALFSSNTALVEKSSIIFLEDGRKQQANENWESVLLDIDNKTPIGFLQRTSAGDLLLKIGSKTLPMPQVLNGYNQFYLLNSGAHVLMSAHQNQGNNVRIYFIAYDTGKILWEYVAMSLFPVNSVRQSTYKNYGLIEIQTNGSKTLYVMDNSTGKVITKFP